MQQQGVGLRVFLGMIDAFCREHAANESMAEFTGPLRELANDWQQLTMQVGQRAVGNAEEVGAASYDYLFYSGYAALAYWWARASRPRCTNRRPRSAGQARHARFYFARVLPRTKARAAMIARRCVRRSWRWSPTRSG